MSSTFLRKSREKTCVILLFLKEAEIDTWQKLQERIPQMAPPQGETTLLFLEEARSDMCLLLF